MDAHSKNQFQLHEIPLSDIRIKQFNDAINGLGILAEFMTNSSDVFKKKYKETKLDTLFQTKGLDKRIPSYAENSFYPPADNPIYKNIIYIKSAFEARLAGKHIDHAQEKDLRSPVALTNFIFNQNPILKKSDKKSGMTEIMRKLNTHYHLISTNEIMPGKAAQTENAMMRENMVEVVRTVVIAPVQPKLKILEPA